MTLFQSSLLQLLFSGVVAFLFLGGIFAIVVGAGLVMRNETMIRLFNIVNRWVPTGEAFKGLDQPHSIEGMFRRQGRLLGAAFLVPAAISIAVLVTKFDVPVVMGVFPRWFPAVVAEMSATSLKWLLTAGNLLAVAVGAALLLFPEVLTKIETPMNRWHTTRAYPKDMDLMYLPLDRWTEAHPRTAGLVMIVLAGFVVLSLGAIVLNRS